mgnify:FL=1
MEEPIPAARNPHPGPRITPERMTTASPGWIYPLVPGVGIRIDMVAAQASAANSAVVTNFFRLEFMFIVSTSFLVNVWYTCSDSSTR